MQVMQALYQVKSRKAEIDLEVEQLRLILSTYLSIRCGSWRYEGLSNGFVPENAQYDSRFVCTAWALVDLAAASHLSLWLFYCLNREAGIINLCASCPLGAAIPLACFFA